MAAPKVPCPTPNRKELRRLSDKQIRDLAESFGLKGTDEVKNFTHWFRRGTEDTPLWVWSLMSPDFAARRHPILGPMVRILQQQSDDARRINQRFGGRWDKITGYDRATGKIRKMTAKEQAEYASVILKTEETNWIPDAPKDPRKRVEGVIYLDDLPLSKKVKEVYREHRRLMPWALKVINITREARGLEPIKGIKGVMLPHEFDGNFHLEKDGKLLYTIHGSSWDTQADAFEALRHHFRLEPGDVGHVEIVADYQKRLSFAVLGDPEHSGALNEALEAVARGSHVSTEKTAQWYREGLHKHGFGTHMLPRMGTEGYDTVNVVRVMSEYLNAMPWWATAELARNDLREFAGKLDVKKEPHSVYAFMRFIAQTYGLPGGLEMQLDQVVNNFTQTKAGRAWARVAGKLESVPLISRPAKFMNPDRLNPVGPMRRATMRGRGLTSDLKLGFMSWSVAMAHALHSPINVLPAYGMKYWAMGFKSALLAHWTPELKGAYDWGINQGVFKGNLMDDAPGGPFTRQINRAADLVHANDTVRTIMMSIWRPLSLSERVLRQSAFFGALHALKDEGVTGHRLLRLATDDAMKEFPQLDKATEKFMLDMAKRVVDQVAFRYDRASRPWWTTAGMGGPVGLMGGQFKTYITGSIALEKRMWDMAGTYETFPERMGGRARALAPLAIATLFGGVAGGIPLAHLIDDATKYLTSGGDPEGKGGYSPLDETYMWFRHNIGGPAAEALYRGIPALEGMDISRRVGFSHLHLENPKDILGAFPNTLMDMVHAITFHDLEHATMLAPGIGNIYQAFRWWEDGYAEDPYHRSRLRFTPTRADIVKRAFGIEPLRQAKMTDIARIAERAKVSYAKDRTSYVDQMVRAWKADDMNEYTRVEAEALAHEPRIVITPTDIAKEVAAKGTGVLERRAKEMPKALRPWYETEFGPELKAEKEREQKARAQRALEQVQAQPEPLPQSGQLAVPGQVGQSGQIAIPGELPR